MQDTANDGALSTSLSTAYKSNNEPIWLSCERY